VPALRSAVVHAAHVITMQIKQKSHPESTRTVQHEVLASVCARRKQCVMHPFLSCTAIAMDQDQAGSAACRQYILQTSALSCCSACAAIYAADLRQHIAAVWYELSNTI
jgi:hypothetical protein